MQAIWVMHVTGDQHVAPIWSAFTGLLYLESYSKYPAAVYPGHVNYQTLPKNIELKRPSALSSMPFDARARPWLPSRRVYRNRWLSFYLPHFHFLHTVGDCLVEKQMLFASLEECMLLQIHCNDAWIAAGHSFAEVGNRNAGPHEEFAPSLQNA
jgi:hypothetical protein